MDSAKQLRDLSKVYMEAVYGGGKKEEKKDTRLTVTAADKKANTKAYQNYKAGNKAYKAADHLKEDEKYGYDKDGNSLNPKDKKAKKDFDGDGKLESPEAEYKGSKDKAIKKELKDLQKAAETGKGKYVAKADKVKVVGEEKKSSMTTYKYSDKFYKAIKKDDKETPKITPKKQLLNKEDVNDEYIEIVQQIKSAETQADIKRWKSLEESGKFTAEEIDMIIENDLDAILARIEEGNQRNPEGSIKDRFKSTQTDPSKAGFTGIGDDIGEIMRQNAAMKKAAAKKVKKEEFELDEAERDLGDRLHRKRKLYDKTVTKAMDDARRTGEASGHNRYRMGSLDREMDGIRAKMKEKEKK